MLSAAFAVVVLAVALRRWRLTIAHRGMQRLDEYPAPTDSPGSQSGAFPSADPAPSAQVARPHGDVRTAETELQTTNRMMHIHEFVHT